VRIVTAKRQGATVAKVAQRFGVGRATVERYLKLERETGAVQPKPIPGRPRAIGPKQEAALDAQVAQHRDATLEEHCRLWAERGGTPVSRMTMARALARLDWPRKKDAARQ
jgi:transposase